jgi:queuine/archaeosine tRNA-ribosyltransferase
MKELPCACPICQNISAEALGGHPKAVRAELISKHNCFKLEEELRKNR